MVLLICLLLGDRDLLCSFGFVVVCKFGFIGRRLGFVLRVGDLLRCDRDGFIFVWKFVLVVLVL